MKEKVKQINSYIDAHKDEIIDMWCDFVNTESSAREKENVDIMGEKLKNVFEEIGFNCELHEVGEENGKALLGIWGEERPGKPILFSGHYDTVFAKGSFGENPFFIDKNGLAHGPGCLDMKGGIVIAIFVIKALMSIGYNERPIKILFLGDEEKGHQQGSAPDFIVENSKDALCAFNMETGLVSNNICIGRKGGGVCFFTVNGVGSHSGNDFLKGRNAIAEMAHKILDIQALTNLDVGTTLSVTIIKGGTVQNSIPPICTIDIDVRYEILSERDRIKKALEEIAAKTYIEGTTTSMEFCEYMPPFETTQDVVNLANFVEGISERYGYGEMGQIRLGGGSDASHITIAKTPCICSMGVRGEFNHTDKEYAIVDTMFERAKLLSATVLHAAEFETNQFKEE